MKKKDIYYKTIKRFFTWSPIGILMPRHPKYLFISDLMVIIIRRFLLPVFRPNHDSLIWLTNAVAFREKGTNITHSLIPEFSSTGNSMTEESFLWRQYFILIVKILILRRWKAFNPQRSGNFFPLYFFTINLKYLIFSVSFLPNSILGRLKCCVGDLKFFLPHKTFSFVVAQFSMKITFLFPPGSW